MKLNSLEEIDTACCKYLLARPATDSKHAVELIKAIIDFCDETGSEREQVSKGARHERSNA